MMKKVGPPPQKSKRRKKPSQLSAEDHAIWRGTAETIKPLKGAKDRVRPQTTTPSETPRAAALSKDEPASRRTRSTVASTRSPVEPAGRPQPTPPISNFDKRSERRLARGQTEVEARLDLHGMRQSEAHAELRRFLNDCVGRGLRHVLVITGKGGPPRERDDGDWSSSAPQSGILRRNVPQWLAEPDLRPMIVSFTPAAIRHGGEGALYVHLRKRDKTR